MTKPKAAKIAVILPCYNEEQTIAAVVADFKQELPDADIYVYDNKSTDDTSKIAQKAGAIVRHEYRQGKGNVVRRMFADIEADVYILADGDGTYAANDVQKLLTPFFEDRLDMVVGVREGVREDAGRFAHAFGNRIFNGIYRLMFREGFSDIFSGYRVFSRRFVKSFPALSSGFEIESELSVHAQSIMAPCKEVGVAYGTRPEGSESKLSTVGDGIRILSVLVLLMKEVRPMLFFGFFALLAAIGSLILGLPVVFEYFTTGMVTLLPRWILSVGLMLLMLILLACGLILDSVARGRVEQKRILYLATSETG